MTELVATGRIVVPYVVDGLTHTFHAYVRNIQTVGATFNINSRPVDSNDVPWGDAAAGLNESLSYIWDATTTCGTMRLEKLIDNVWQILATQSGSNPHGANTYWPAASFVMTLRDKLYKQVKVVVEEPVVTPPQHFVDPLGSGAAVDNFTKQWMSTFTVSGAPYYWQVGRSNQFLAVDPFVSMSFGINRKTRKRRGV